MVSKLNELFTCAAELRAHLHLKHAPLQLAIGHAAARPPLQQFRKAAEPIGEVRLLSCGKVDAAAACNQREAKPLVVRLEREGAEYLRIVADLEPGHLLELDARGELLRLDGGRGEG